MIEDERGKPPIPDAPPVTILFPDPVTAKLTVARYDAHTRWPLGFDPVCDVKSLE